MCGACYAARMSLRLTVSLTLFLATAGCAKHEAAPPAPTATTAPGAAAKDPALARSLLAQGAAVIDVRSPEEFASGHIDRAVNIPVDELPARLDDVRKVATKDQPVVVYCASGHRAAKAKQALTAAGYSRVVNGGGFDDLK